MNSVETQAENAHRQQALMDEAQSAQLLGQAALHNRVTPRLLWLVVGAAITLGTQIKAWAGAFVSQNYLPGLHID